MTLTWPLSHSLPEGYRYFLINSWVNAPLHSLSNNSQMVLVNSFQQDFRISWVWIIVNPLLSVLPGPTHLFPVTLEFATLGNSLPRWLLRCSTAKKHPEQRGLFYLRRKKQAFWYKGCYLKVGRWTQLFHPDLHISFTAQFRAISCRKSHLCMCSSTLQSLLPSFKVEDCISYIP